MIVMIYSQLARTPESYSEESLGTVDHEDLKRSITNFYRKTYTSHTNFETRLKSTVLVRFHRMTIITFCVIVA